MLVMFLEIIASSSFAILVAKVVVGRTDVDVKLAKVHRMLRIIQSSCFERRCSHVLKKIIICKISIGTTSRKSILGYDVCLDPCWLMFDRSHVGSSLFGSSQDDAVIRSQS